MIGIYAIKQRSTGVVYIGRSINITKRWVNHRSSLNRGKHHAPWLQRAWAKHGAADFEFSLLEECVSEALPAREAFWLTSCAATFNNMRSVDGGVIAHGPESKVKMSISQRERFQKTPAQPISIRQREQIGLAHRGKVVSRETRDKQSASAQARHPVSAETREKLRQANFKRTYPSMSDEQKEKLRISHTGKTLSPEHRLNIGKSLLRVYRDGSRKEQPKGPRARAET